MTAVQQHVYGIRKAYLMLTLLVRLCNHQTGSAGEVAMFESYL